MLLAVGLGFVQEFRAERALEALRAMAAPLARVLRDGAEAEIPAREIVPGDVILLSAGDRVPADARVVSSQNLAVEEAVLTGESAAVRKTEAALEDAELGLADRVNVVYAGTLVTYGRGRALVVGTGMATEFGRISSLVEEVEPARTPLQQNLDRLGATLGKAALAVIGLIVVLGLARGQPPIDMFLFGISLAAGVRRMVRRQALVRRLPVVETLGSTSVICMDKTGTFTRNQMTVRRVITGEGTYELTGIGYDPTGELRRDGRPASLSSALREVLRAGALASDARLTSDQNHWQIVGDPTEGALLVAAAKLDLDLDGLARAAPRVDEIPFTSERRRMTTLHESQQGAVAYSKGAVDVVLESCTRRLVEDGEQPLEADDRYALLAAERAMAAEGLRVLALTRKRADRVDEAEQDMTFLGLVGMMDPPRAEAAEAVRVCGRAGITPVMITGDHPLTARAVAEEIGLLEEREVVAGPKLEAMSDPELERAVPGIGVYARVSPADKLRVVSAWQAHGEVVAMTGDGINDAPALKKADVGIAMGITGTDVSKEAAAITLLDDNFASILAAGGGGADRFQQHQEVSRVPTLLERRRDRADGGRRPGRPADAPHRGPDPLRQSGHRRPARAGARGGSSRGRSDAQASPRSPRGHLHAPSPRAAAGGRSLVRAGEPRALHPPATERATAGRGHGDDLRVAGPDPVREGVRVPLRPRLDAEAALRQSVAQPRHPLGAGAAGGGGVGALPPGAFPDLRLRVGGLGPSGRAGPEHPPRARGGEVDGSPGVARGARVRGAATRPRRSRRAYSRASARGRPWVPPTGAAARSEVRGVPARGRGRRRV